MSINSFINKTKTDLKQNRKLFAALRIMATPVFASQNTAMSVGSALRKLGVRYNKYAWLREIKGKYCGQRCFAVATGPSLTMDDLKMLQGEFCFGMNSHIKAFNATSWRPDWYIIQDEYVYEKLEEDIIRASSENKNMNIAVGNVIFNRFKSARNFNTFPIHYLDRKMYHRHGFGKFKYSDDCYSIVYDGSSVLMSVLQLASYMGFREIYLLGCDCNYQLPNAHFIEHGVKDINASSAGDKLIQAHTAFKQFADAHGLEVINCTRGGMLEVYPRKPLEDVLGSHYDGNC